MRGTMGGLRGVSRESQVGRGGVLNSVQYESKAEIRRPKAERSPRCEVPNPAGPQRRGSPSAQAILGFRVSVFFGPSGFGFRILGLRLDFRAALRVGLLKQTCIAPAGWILPILVELCGLSD